MRKISIFAFGFLAGMVILTNTASAQEVMNTNIKTEIHSKDNLSGYKGNYITYILENENYSASPEDIERDKILNERKAKMRNFEVSRGTININASAYTAAADECGKNDGITASGLKVKEKRTLACPPQYPFGTRLKIEGMGTYTCEDRGGAIKGNRFDIYMETKSEAFQFGRKHLMAEVI
jgi:3D (Asp-Asp-Asp) domain-containing protein